MSLHQWIPHLPGKHKTLWVLACLIGGAICFGIAMFAMMYVTLD